jgi:hypothetical protein
MERIDREYPPLRGQSPYRRLRDTFFPSDNDLKGLLLTTGARYVLGVM